MSVWGLGVGVESSGFRGEDHLRIRPDGSGRKAQGVGFRVHGLGFRVEGQLFRV